MAKTLNIKKLAKGMSLQDKARLIFADHDKRMDSGGVEWILTPYEKEAIYKDARENNQIGELNRLTDEFNVAVFLMVDVKLAFSNFNLATAGLLGIITSILIKNSANDIIGQILWDLVVSKEKDKKKRDRLFKELEKKYIHENKLFQQFDYFTPAYSLDEPKVKTAPEPNTTLQQIFMTAIRRVKALRGIIYQINYVVKLAGIDFLPYNTKKELREYEKYLDEFVKLEGVYKIVKLYIKFADEKLIRTANLIEPAFLETIRDVEKAIQLNKKDIEKAEAEVGEMSDKFSKVNFNTDAPY